jgi:hypothetical protein
MYYLQELGNEEVEGLADENDVGIPRDKFERRSVVDLAGGI